MEPQDQTAVIGSRVTLPCRVIDKSGQLQWTKDDFGLGTHRNLSGFERYTMIGSDEEGKIYKRCKVYLQSHLLNVHKSLRYSLDERSSKSPFTLRT